MLITLSYEILQRKPQINRTNKEATRDPEGSEDGCVDVWYARAATGGREKVPALLASRAGKRKVQQTWGENGNRLSKNTKSPQTERGG